MVIAPLADGLVRMDLPFARSLSGALGIGLVVAFALSRRARLRLADRRVRFFLCYVCASAISLSWTISDRAGADRVAMVRSYLQYLQPVILYLLIHAIARDASWTRTASRLYVLAATLLATIVVLGPESLMQSEPGDGRAGLEWINLNGQAVMYGIAVVILYSWVIHGRRGPGERALALVAVAILGAALLATGSRGGAVGLVVGLTTATVTRLSRRSGWAIGVASLIAVGYLLTPRAEVTVRRFDRAVTGEDTGMRRELAVAAWEMIREKPFLGWGPGYSSQLGAQAGRASPVASHNWYLEMLLVFGLIGSGPWLLGLGATFGPLLRHARSPVGSTCLSIGGLILAVGLTGHLGTVKIVWVFLAIAGSVEHLSRRRTGGGEVTTDQTKHRIVEGRTSSAA